MVGRDELEELTDSLIDASKADDVEVMINHNDTALTRYANSKIHQNVGQEDSSVSIRVAMGKKVGAASTNSLKLEDAKRSLKKAEAIAEHQREDPDFKGLPEDKEISRKVGKTYYERTAEYSPEERAQKVKEIIEYSEEHGVDRVYGAFKTQDMDLFVGNSNGVRKYNQLTAASLSTTAIADWDNDQGFGWGESCSADVDDIDHMDVAGTAVEKGLNNFDTKTIDLGDYDVVLEPLAVKSILMYLGMMGFSARKVQEERSFMCGRFGEQFMDDRVNIYDDALDPSMHGFPFDYEGVPKQRVDLVKDGTANAVVYDTYTAGREEGKESTGHSLPQPNPMSPFPMNMLMDGGSSSIDEMIEETDKGILVTRFNYCGPVHPVKGILTGLTRDGTWMIEDGEVSYPVNNLRFTQNLIEALNSVDSITKEKELFSLGYYPGYIACPGLKIDDFSFTGTTEF